MDLFGRWGKKLDKTTSPDFVGPGEELKHAGRNPRSRTILETKGKERLHSIIERPELQEFIASILKPFFNIAPVMRHNGKWYSQEPKKDGIVHPLTPQHATVDMRMLEFLVGDADHRLDGTSNSMEPNIAFTEDSYYFFDFADAKHFFRMGGSQNDLVNFRHFMSQESDDMRAYARDKLERMRAHLESVQGREDVERQFHIADKTIDNLFIEEGRTFDEFYSKLVERTRMLQDVIR